MKYIDPKGEAFTKGLTPVWNEGFLSRPGAHEFVEIFAKKKVK